MWSDKYHAGHCGTWQKQYTKLHRGKHSAVIMHFWGLSIGCATSTRSINSARRFTRDVAKGSGVYCGYIPSRCGVSGLYHRWPIAFCQYTKLHRGKHSTVIMHFWGLSIGCATSTRSINSARRFTRDVAKGSGVYCGYIPSRCGVSGLYHRWPIAFCQYTKLHRGKHSTVIMHFWGLSIGCATSTRSINSARRFTRGVAKGKLSSGVYRGYIPSRRGVSGLYHRWPITFCHLSLPWIHQVTI